jgi:arginase
MDITLIYVPYDLDEYRVGMGLAPEALKEAALGERLQAEKILVKEHLQTPADLGDGSQMERLGRLVASISDLVVQAHANQTLPVILGGDCMGAIGVCSGLQRCMGAYEFGIAWFDAHGDFNTPDTTLTGYLGGMPLACICGHGLDGLRKDAGLKRPIDESYVMMLGVRNLDPPEKDLLDSTPIVHLSPEEIAAGKTGSVIRNQFENVSGVYLHLDIDAIDPADAPGVNYLTPNGISRQQAVAAAGAIIQHTPLAALTLSAINPALDQEGKTVETGINLLVEILSLIE